jgi:hypothetical protein
MTRALRAITDLAGAMVAALTLGLSLGTLLVAVTAWLTSRIARLELLIERRFTGHEKDCQNYLAADSSPRLPRAAPE